MPNRFSTKNNWHQTQKIKKHALHLQQRTIQILTNDVQMIILFLCEIDTRRNFKILEKEDFEKGITNFHDFNTKSVPNLYSLAANYLKTCSHSDAKSV